MPNTIDTIQSERIIKLLTKRRDSLYCVRNFAENEYGKNDPYFIKTEAEWLERCETLALLLDPEFFEQIWHIYMDNDEKEGGDNA